MASALQKLLRKSQPFRFITAFNPSQAPNPILPLPPQSHHPPSLPPTTPTHHFAPSTLIFPTFPFALSSKPIFATGFCSPQAEDEDSRTLWADSVKKKRKRKMNKHKYQKLRKRMRRQS